MVLGDIDLNQNGKDFVDSSKIAKKNQKTYANLNACNPAKKALKKVVADEPSLASTSKVEKWLGFFDDEENEETIYQTQFRNLRSRTFKQQQQQSTKETNDKENQKPDEFDLLDLADRPNLKDNSLESSSNESILISKKTLKQSSITITKSVTNTSKLPAYEPTKLSDSSITNMYDSILAKSAQKSRLTKKAQSKPKAAIEVLPEESIPEPPMSNKRPSSDLHLFEEPDEEKDKISDYDFEELTTTPIKKKTRIRSAEKKPKPVRTTPPRQTSKKARMSKLKRAEQEEQDKKDLERWRKEYDEIKNYKLIVEKVDHDY